MSEPCRRWHTGAATVLVALVLALLAACGASRAEAQTAAVAAPAPQGFSNNGFAIGPSEEVANPGVGPIFSAPFSSSHLFGDWGGARSWLVDHGVNVNVDVLEEGAGNITGGRRQGFDLSGQVGFETDLDLQKLVGLQGAEFHTMIVNGNGRNTSGDYIGDDLADVQEIYGGRGNVVAHLVYAYGQKSFFNNHLDVIGGWLPVGTYFASSPIYCNFLSVVICNPETMFSYPTGTEWPIGSFGGLLRIVPNSHMYAMVGLFSTDLDHGPGGGGISGWAWADPHKSGVNIPVELGYVPNLGPQKLVGHYKVGFHADTHRYASVEQTLYPPGTTHGGTRRLFYVLTDQMLARQGPGDTNGLVAFAGWLHATDQVSPFTQQAYAGLRTTGTPWGRPGDGIDFVWQWLEMSGGYTRAQEALASEGGSVGAPIALDGFGPAYGPQNTEQIVELNYEASVYRGVTLVPDFQYIIRPGATTHIPDAAVLAFRVNVNL